MEHQSRSLPDQKLRVVISVTCLLSIIGSLTIISSYVFFKSLRTTTRLILVHLSIMDLGVAIANFIGIAVNFDKYYYRGEPTEPWSSIFASDPGTLINVACVTQAALAVYFTAGSFMWTLTMAIYMYFKIVQSRDKKLAQRTYYASVIFSYLFPLVLVAWKGSLHRLGYSPSDSEGWCGDKVVDPVTGKRHILMSVLGYNIWVFLIYTLVPIIYLAVLLHIRLLIKQSELITSSSVQITNLVDVKLLLIPIAFLVLRIWSFVSTFAFLYLQIMFNKDVNYAIQYLAGIGDSGQGFVNAILFVLLTKRVREKLFCYKCCYRSKSNERKPILDSGSIQIHSSIQKHYSE